MTLSPLASFLCAGPPAATLGVLMAVPLRRRLRRELPYVDGLAAAETITVLDPPRERLPRWRNALARSGP